MGHYFNTRGCVGSRALKAAWKNLHNKYSPASWTDIGEKRHRQALKTQFKASTGRGGSWLTVLQGCSRPSCRAPPGRGIPSWIQGESRDPYTAKVAILPKRAPKAACSGTQRQAFPTGGEFREGLSRWVFTASTFRVIVSTLQP